MIPWQWIKNNIPPYAEEITINQVQETLSNFKQLIPDNFVELEQLNWMCSTQGWKEPICERYNCLINGEWKQIDIRHSLLEELGLEAKNIPYSLHISPTVLDKGLDHYFAYNVEKEKEIFLNRPLTVNDLPAALQKWKDEIKTLKEQNTNKNNRLFQVNQIFQSSDLIFQGQQQIIADLLKIQLLKEQNESGAIKAYTDRLKEKNKLLDKQKEELSKRVEELDQATQSNSELRDKELERAYEIEEWFKSWMYLPEEFLWKWWTAEENANFLEKWLSEDEGQKKFLEEWRGFIDLIREGDFDDNFWKDDYNKWDKWKDHLRIYVKEFCLKEFTSFVENLQKWPAQFPDQTPQQVQEKINSLANGNNEPVYQELRKQISSLKEGHDEFIEKIEKEVGDKVGRNWNTTIYCCPSNREGDLIANLGSAFQRLKEREKLLINQLKLYTDNFKDYYKLEDFLRWLEENPDKKMGLSDWHSFCDKKNKNILKSFVIWAEFTNQQGNLWRILTEDYRRTEVILEWKKIVDKKE